MTTENWTTTIEANTDSEIRSRLFTWISESSVSIVEEFRLQGGKGAITLPTARMKDRLTLDLTLDHVDVIEIVLTPDILLPVWAYLRDESDKPFSHCLRVIARKVVTGDPRPVWLVVVDMVDKKEGPTVYRLNSRIENNGWCVYFDKPCARGALVYVPIPGETEVSS